MRRTSMGEVPPGVCLATDSSLAGDSLKQDLLKHLKSAYIGGAIKRLPPEVEQILREKPGEQEGNFVKAGVSRRCGDQANVAVNDRWVEYSAVRVEYREFYPGGPQLRHEVNTEGIIYLNKIHPEQLALLGGWIDNAEGEKDPINRISNTVKQNLTELESERERVAGGALVLAEAFLNNGLTPWAALLTIQAHETNKWKNEAKPNVQALVSAGVSDDMAHAMMLILGIYRSINYAHISERTVDPFKEQRQAEGALYPLAHALVTASNGDDTLLKYTLEEANDDIAPETKRLGDDWLSLVTRLSGENNLKPASVAKFSDPLVERLALARGGTDVTSEQLDVAPPRISWAKVWIGDQMLDFLSVGALRTLVGWTERALQAMIDEPRNKSNPFRLVDSICKIWPIVVARSEAIAKLAKVETECAELANTVRSLALQLESHQLTPEQARAISNLVIRDPNSLDDSLGALGINSSQIPAVRLQVLLASLPLTHLEKAVRSAADIEAVLVGCFGYCYGVSIFRKGPQESHLQGLIEKHTPSEPPQTPVKYSKQAGRLATFVEPSDVFYMKRDGYELVTTVLRKLKGKGVQTGLTTDSGLSLAYEGSVVTIDLQGMKIRVAKGSPSFKEAQLSISELTASNVKDLCAILDEVDETVVTPKNVLPVVGAALAAHSELGVIDRARVELSERRKVIMGVAARWEVQLDRIAALKGKRLSPAQRDSILSILYETRPQDVSWYLSLGDANFREAGVPEDLILDLKYQLALIEPDFYEWVLNKGKRGVLRGSVLNFLERTDKVNGTGTDEFLKQIAQATTVEQVPIKRNYFTRSMSSAIEEACNSRIRVTLGKVKYSIGFTYGWLTVREEGKSINQTDEAWLQEQHSRASMVAVAAVLNMGVGISSLGHELATELLAVVQSKLAEQNDTGPSGALAAAKDYFSGTSLLRFVERQLLERVVNQSEA
jgi:hypothetical protein